MPAASIARTTSSCGPARRSLNCGGDGHEPKSGASSAHSKVASGSLEEKVNAAVVSSVVGDGPERIVVSGPPAVEVDEIANGDRLATSPQTRPATGSLERVTSVQVPLSLWRMRTGSASAAGLKLRQT